MPLSPLVPLVLSLASANVDGKAPTVDFSRDVRPILEAHCIECHGPKKQKGKLRFDRRDSVFAGEPSEWHVVPGKPEESHVFLRVSLPAEDPDVMPAEGEHLDAKDIAVIRTWIAEGALWTEAAPEATAKPLPAAEREPLRPEPAIALPPLEPAAAARLEHALAALRARGASAVRIAQDTEAIDVNLSLLAANATDADVALLAGLEPRLFWLDLARTAVTDKGLAPLRDCVEIRRLSLASTSIGDAGLEELAKLGKLESLNLFGTSVTDAGLARLAGLRTLKRLFLWRTAVTDAGIEKIRAAIPGLSIDRGGYAEEMAKLAPPPLPPQAAVNALCPISGKAVQAGFVFTHQGKTVGFCCGDCLAKFKANPDAFPLK